MFFQYWSSILALRNRTVILSFGTYIKTSTMPEAYKQTLRAAMAAFHDVTFIWKYEVRTIIIEDTVSIVCVISSVRDSTQLIVLNTARKVSAS